MARPCGGMGQVGGSERLAHRRGRAWRRGGNKKGHLVRRPSGARVAAVTKKVTAWRHAATFWG